MTAAAVVVAFAMGALSCLLGLARLLEFSLRGKP